MATIDEEPRVHDKPKNMITSPIFLSSDALRSILSYHTLIDHFQITLPSLSKTINSPTRQSHSVTADSQLLLMPSWSCSPSLPYIGVKLVTHFSRNSTLNLPSVNASYVLFDSLTGQTLSYMDGTELTLWRTACVSGLASKLLSLPQSETLVMVGAGALAPYLIKAHLAARPSLRRVIIWNRTEEKARKLAEELSGERKYVGVRFEGGIGCLDELVKLGDIVSCATNSASPLVKGEALKDGAHLDLVGSFNRWMRECDDVAIRRGRVFVDNEAALVEAGELVGAFERRVISCGDIGGELAELISGERNGRRSEEEVTVFKSVGSAVVDILAAQLVYEASMKDINLQK